MNATRVSASVGRRPGILLTIFLLLAMLPLRAAEITATITGVLEGGWDHLGIFATGADAKNMAGRPFTLVFTFDDTKGTPQHGQCNGAAGSGVEGGGPDSPGKAVLTIGSASYTFGENGGSSGAWREVPGACSSTSLIGFYVNGATAHFDFAPEVDVKMMPGKGSNSLTRNPDWRAPLSTTAVDNQTSCFVITRHGGGDAKGCFDIKKLEITKR